MTRHPDGERIQRLLEQGLRALDAGSFQDALTHWNEILAIDPQHTRAARLVADLESLIARTQPAEPARPANQDVVEQLDDLIDNIDADDLLDVELDESPDRRATDPGINNSMIPRSALQRLQRLVESLSEETAQLNELLRARYEELLAVRETLTQREHDLLSAREQHLKLERQIVGLEHSRRSKERDAALAESTLADIEVRATEAMQREAAMQERASTLESELLRMRNDRDASRAESIASLQAVEEARQRLQLAEQSHKQMRRQLTEARNEMSEAKQARDTMQAELEAATAARDSLQAEIAAHTASVSALTSQCDDLQQQLVLQQQTHQTALNALDQQRREAETARDDARAAAKAEASQVDQLQTRVRELEAQLQRRTRERDESQARAQQHQEEAQQALTRADQLEQQARVALAERDDALIGLERMRTQSDGQVESLEQRLQLLAQENAELQESLTTHDQLAAQLQTLLSQPRLRTTLTDLKPLDAQTLQAETMRAEGFQVSDTRSRGDFTEPDRDSGNTNPRQPRLTDTDGGPFEDEAFLAAADQALAEVPGHASTTIEASPSPSDDVLAFFAADNDALPPAHQVAESAAPVEDDIFTFETDGFTDAGQQTDGGQRPDASHDEDLLRNLLDEIDGSPIAPRRGSDSYGLPHDDDLIDALSHDDGAAPGQPVDDSIPPEFNRQEVSQRTVAGMDPGKIVQPDSLFPREPTGVDAEMARQLLDNRFPAFERMQAIAHDVPLLTDRPVHSVPNFTARHAFVASRVDGQTSFGDIIDLAGPQRDETCAVLLELIRHGILISPSLQAH